MVLGSRMADRVAARGVAADRINVIANWCEDDKIHPVFPSENPLRREWKLEDKFVIGYSGNLGRAHEFDTVLAAADRLKSNPEIIFLCIGGGHLMKRLAECVRERNLGNFRFMDYQDQSTLGLSLCVPDVHWISLLPQVEGLIVPSKIYGIAAAGRPVIAICDNDGEIARLVEQYQCGGVVEPGNSDGLTNLILRLSTDSTIRAEMGQHARAMLDAHFTRHQALERWRALLQRVGEPH